MAIVSFLKLPISAARLAEIAQDLREMLELARQQLGLRWMETSHIWNAARCELAKSAWG